MTLFNEVSEMTTRTRFETKTLASRFVMHHVMLYMTAYLLKLTKETTE